MCDRILRHPIPLAYTRHTSRFLIIGLATMPFALWNACGWAVIPVEVFISFMLLGIEEIGVQVRQQGREQCSMPAAAVFGTCCVLCTPFVGSAG